MQRTSDAEVCRRVLIEGRSAFIGGLDDVWSSTKACTAYLADSIGQVARGFGATVKREYALGVYRDSTRGGRPCRKQGYLDLLAEFPDGSKLAIEIDTNYKAWSATKLRFAKGLGMTELWVRWDGAYTWEQEMAVLNIESPRRNWHSSEGRGQHGHRPCSADVYQGAAAGSALSVTQKPDAAQASNS